MTSNQWVKSGKMALRDYLLTKQLKGKLKKKGKDQCNRCKVELKPNEKIVSTSKQKNFYCMPCAVFLHMVVIS